MARLSMLIDLRTCIGCHACSVACKAEFDVPLGTLRNTVKYVENGQAPQALRHFIPVLCNHCEDAPCTRVCPSRAVIRLDGGQVVIDKDRCRGKQECIEACPYGAITLHPDSHKAQKCTLCVHRTEQGQAPACVEACPTKTRIFGDLDDPGSELARRLAATPTVAWREHDGTRPKVRYVDTRGALPLLAEQTMNPRTQKQRR
ncbi:MAG: 4Fe-4S dicluster domain-containing protein [Deltaproteobacteria bacterium]|nr:4Fe-4S dicluster domain-containing protein [Deltaproteobacteria bacterium]